MKKLLFITLIVTFTLALTACGNETKKDFHDFSNTYKDVKQKQKNVEEIMDKIHLKELDNLSKTDTTDKNKKEFIALQKDINNYLMPEFKKYKNSTKNLPAKTNEVRDLRAKYLNTVKDKEASIKDLKLFVGLCNRSIKDNEDILDYTKLFEKNRSEVESDINKATNRDDANQLKSKLEDNNKQLKATAKKYLDSSTTNSDSAQEAIKNHISPLIEKQITEINQTNISDQNVDNARKNAIEMHYSLQNYYDTRVDTIKVSEKLSKIDVNQLPKEGKDISKMDKSFNRDFKQLKQNVN
ncbi:EMYY motif lipoprotein [Staphylococcus saccharolyticus]|uniref:EMYY motif lipoprotein n=1 Tax=Staphylococcus saccharolyticus TaxID=33028 RepID=UPI0032DFF81D